MTYEVNEDTPEWQFVVASDTPDINLPLPSERSFREPMPSPDRYVTISVLHHGVPVFVAEGPLKVTVNADGFAAIGRMMDAANRKQPVTATEGP